MIVSTSPVLSSEGVKGMVHWSNKNLVGWWVTHWKWVDLTGILTSFGSNTSGTAPGGPSYHILPLGYM